METWSQGIGNCCNFTDHIGLPIIHINNRHTQQRQETRTSEQNNILYYNERVHTIQRTEIPSHLAQQPNIYELQIVTIKYLSVWSTDTTLCGRPNL